MGWMCMSFAICGVMTCWSRCPFRFTFPMACAMQGHCGRKFHTSFTVGNLWQGMGMPFHVPNNKLLQWKLQESYSLHTFNALTRNVISFVEDIWCLRTTLFLGSCRTWQLPLSLDVDGHGVKDHFWMPKELYQEMSSLSSLSICNPWQELNDHAKHLRNIDDRCAPVIGCFA